MTMNDDIAAARKLLDAVRASDRAQYDHWRFEDEGDPPYDEKCFDRIHGFAVLAEGLSALERERAREKLETCWCCGAKLWNCGCWANLGPDGFVTCWGTHGPSLAAKLAAENAVEPA